MTRLHATDSFGIYIFFSMQLIHDGTVHSDEEIFLFKNKLKINQLIPFQMPSIKCFLLGLVVSLLRLTKKNFNSLQSSSSLLHELIPLQ